ncbi:MAG: hypothetical protein P4N24_13280 [Acidobacteriota bacterium]|nr:hypothetical protein [Acidobacteriota bacterium]
MPFKGDQLLLYGVQYATYALEVWVCVSLASSGRWRRLKGLGLYVASLILLDGVARPAISNFFGRESLQFYYFYWITDVVFALGAFLVICGFFRRACAQEDKMWKFVRLLLIFVFLVVLGVSTLSLTRHYTHLYDHFIIEFSQTLYFTCLVLNTLLYVMLQQLAIDDDELGLLVCGIGVQFAGEAACLALMHLTADNAMARVLIEFLAPGCTLAMLWIWVYAIGKTPQTVSSRQYQPGKNKGLVEAVAD